MKPDRSSTLTFKVPRASAPMQLHLVSRKLSRAGYVKVMAGCGRTSLVLTTNLVSVFSPSKRTKVSGKQSKSRRSAWLLNPAW